MANFQILNPINLNLNRDNRVTNSQPQQPNRSLTFSQPRDYSSIVNPNIRDVYGVGENPVRKTTIIREGSLNTYHYGKPSPVKVEALIPQEIRGLSTQTYISQKGEIAEYQQDVESQARKNVQNFDILTPKQQAIVIEDEYNRRLQREKQVYTDLASTDVKYNVPEQKKTYDLILASAEEDAKKIDELYGSYKTEGNKYEGLPLEADDLFNQYNFKVNLLSSLGLPLDAATKEKAKILEESKDILSETDRRNKLNEYFGMRADVAAEAYNYNYDQNRPYSKESEKAERDYNRAMNDVLGIQGIEGNQYLTEREIASRKLIERIPYGKKIFYGEDETFKSALNKAYNPIEGVKTAFTVLGEGSKVASAFVTRDLKGYKAYDVTENVWGKAKEIDYKINDWVYDKSPTLGRARKTASDVIYGSGENLASGVARNPVAFGAMIYVGAAGGGIVGAGGKQALKTTAGRAGKLLLYTAEAELVYQGIGQLYSQATLSTEDFRNIDVKKLDKIRAEALGKERQIAGADNQWFGARKYGFEAPFVGGFFGSKSEYNKYIESQDLSNSEKQYLKQARTGYRIGRDASLILMSERVSEIAGRKQFIKDASKAISLKKSLAPSFSRGFGVVGSVAPYEILTTAQTESSFYGQPVEYGYILEQSPKITGIAAGIGGTLIYTQASSQKFANVKTKQGRFKKGLSTFTEKGLSIGVEFQEQFREQLGDWAADATELLSGTKKRAMIGNLKGKGYNPYIFVEVESPTQTRTNTRSKTQSQETFTTSQESRRPFKVRVKTEQQVEPDLENPQLMIKANVDTQTKANINEEAFIELNPYLTIGSVTDVPVKEKTEVGTKADTIVKTKVETETTVRTEVPVKANIKIDDKYDNFFYPVVFPFGAGQGGKGKKTSGRKKLKTAYIPSFDAVVKGIYTKKKPIKRIYSGEETRPIYDPFGKESRKSKAKGFRV